MQHKLWSIPVKMKENVTNWSRYEHMPHIHRMVIWKGLNWLSNRLGMDFRDGGLVADWIGMFFLDRMDKRLIEIIRLDAEYAMQLLGEILPKWVCPRRYAGRTKGWQCATPQPKRRKPRRKAPTAPGDLLGRWRRG